MLKYRKKEKKKGGGRGGGKRKEKEEEEKDKKKKEKKSKIQLGSAVCCIDQFINSVHIYYWAFPLLCQAHTALNSGETTVTSDADNLVEKIDLKWLIKGMNGHTL